MSDVGAITSIVRDGVAAQEFALRLMVPWHSGLTQFVWALLVGLMLIYITWVAWRVVSADMPVNPIRHFGFMILAVLFLEPRAVALNDPNLFESTGGISGQGAQSQQYVAQGIYWTWVAVTELERALYSVVGNQSELGWGVSENGAPLAALQAFAMPVREPYEGTDLPAMLGRYHRSCTEISTTGSESEHGRAVWTLFGLSGGAGLGAGAEWKDDLLGSDFAPPPEPFRGIGIGGMLAGWAAETFGPSPPSVDEEDIFDARGRLEAVSVNPEPGFYVPNHFYWSNRLGDDPDRNPFDGASGYVPPPLAFRHPRETELIRDVPGWEEANRNRWFAENCRELWELNEHAFMYMRSGYSLYYASDSDAVTFGGSDDEDPANTAATISTNMAVTLLNGRIRNAMAGEEDALGRLRGSHAGPGLDGASGAISWAQNTFEWLAELALPYYIFFAIGVVALGCGFMFVLAPVVVGFSLLPGREETIWFFLKVVITLKLVLFLQYLAGHLGSFMTLVAHEAMVSGTATDGIGMASFAPLVITANLATLFFVMVGAPAAAVMIVQANTRGLAALRSSGLAASIGKGVAALAVAAKGISAGARGVRAIAGKSGPAPAPAAPTPITDPARMLPAPAGAYGGGTAGSKTGPATRLREAADRAARAVSPTYRSHAESKDRASRHQAAADRSNERKAARASAAPDPGEQAPPRRNPRMDLG